MLPAHGPLRTRSHAAANRCPPTAINVRSIHPSCRTRRPRGHDHGSQARPRKPGGKLPSRHGSSRSQQSVEEGGMGRSGGEGRGPSHGRGTPTGASPRRRRRRRRGERGEGRGSLHFTIPLALIAMDSLDDVRHYFLLSIVSCYSLFPLLFENQEYPIKVLLLLTYGALMWVGFSSHFAADSAREGKKVKGSGSLVKKKFTGWISLGYLSGMLAIELWSRVFHHHVFGDRLPFLPLMMVSVYCGVGMMYSWMWQLSWIVRHT